MGRMREFENGLLSATVGFVVMSACGGQAPSSASSSAVTKSSSGTASTGVVDSGVQDASLPNCNWPTELDRANYQPGKCVADRVSDLCQVSGLNGKPDCKNLCNPNEYGVSCGGIRPGSGADPNQTNLPLPANCRSLGGDPGGNSHGCCPCEQ